MDTEGYQLVNGRLSGAYITPPAGAEGAGASAHLWAAEELFDISSGVYASIGC